MAPRAVPLLCKVTFVALGPDHSIAITIDGKIWTWGSNKYGQLGYSIQGDKSLVPHEVQLKKIVVTGAAAGKFHSAIITSNGSIFTWGTNNGQLGMWCS
jgi:alpha-tubulin suppressor-like RCC1 family protein